MPKNNEHKSIEKITTTLGKETSFNGVLRFKESLKIERVPDGKTTPSEVFIKRCEMFKENPPVPPGETWDGVFRLTSK